MHYRPLRDLVLQWQVTAILYANPDWAPGHGGELRLWIPPGASDRRHTDASSMDDRAMPDKHTDGSASVPPFDHADQAGNRSTSSRSSHDLGRHNGANPDLAALLLPVESTSALTHGLCMYPEV